MIKTSDMIRNKPEKSTSRLQFNIPIIWILGGPGSGKGTQCKKIAEKYKFIHLSVGDLLRQEVSSESEVGKKVADIMKNGELVPTEIVLQLLEIAMKKSLNHGHQGFLIDGYPRKSEQSVEFEKCICPVDLIIYLECANETLLKRVLTRAANAGNSSIRTDDNEISVKTRIDLFRLNNDSILEQYPDLVKKINAEGNQEEVFEECCSIIDEFLNRVSA